MNTLNPEFVKGGPASPAVFSHYAVRADSASGQHASVWLGQSGGSWSVQNVTTDTSDVTFTAQDAGAFSEPQINAWYRVSGDRVLPLNDAARTAVGESVSVAAYQERVHGLYADKLPGSEYARKHMMGGGAVQSTEDGVSPILPIGGAVLVGGGLAAYLIRRRTA
ncbi:hypothetical protein D5S17_13480 [Pseudonocardiaceae bacterium YIM PH 21723]|nr:hypothetical protein D5S17_13480 [Pseudonocardiaceae bacterium YIM PH 21723]